MNRFWIVTKFNVKFLFSNWMSRIFIFLITGLILLTSLYYKDQISQNEKKDVVTVSVNDTQIEHFLEGYDEQIKIVTRDADIEILKKSESNYQVNIKKENIKESSINFVYGVLDSALNPKKYLIEITKDYKETNSLFGIIISFLIYISLLFIGNIVITSVSLEKTSKMLDLISYKVSALTLVYGKCISILIYILSLGLICIGELFILDYFHIVELKSLVKDLNIANLSSIEWGGIAFALLVALLVFMQLYIVTALFIVDSSQLQLSQLPMTLLTFSCYSINLISLMDDKYNYLVDYTQFIPFSFPFGVLLKIFVFDNLTNTFLFTGICISICFVLITFWIIKQYLLPKKLV